MDRFADVDDQYDPHAVEERVFEYWGEVDAYEKTVEHRADGEDFFFVDGPPYTSGSAHMGTTWNKTLKDIYIRYLRMQGYDVADRPGYDMHGLPIETKVEERLDFQNKKDIEEFGEDAFIEECKSFADEQLEGLQSDFQDFGVWMDWENPYKTVEPEYMEAAWWGFENAHERGLVEQGKRSINQCPRCETAIANNEVEYDQVEKPSVYVKFPLSSERASSAERSSADRSSGQSPREDGDAASDPYLVIWTTTPWTIVANTFVAVDGELEYVGVDAEKDGETERLYVAEAVVEDVLKEGRYEDYEIVEHLDGEDLVGWEYDHPLAEEVPDHAQATGSGQVYTAEYVEADRTGLVHSAPGHGEEDFERGQQLDLEVFCPVGPNGEYTEEAGKYAGTFVRDANEEIIGDLDDHGLLLAHDTTSVREGHCWRCDTDIVRIVTDQWFITITDIKDELLELIEDSEWHPEWARDNRFRDFVEEAPDWNVSRQRYWGIPIPIWTPKESADSSTNGGGEATGGWSGEMDDAIVIGDREELAERVDQDIDPEDVDLHKDTVDDLTITDGETTYTRVEDVFDVWLDSSVATWGTLNYPEQTEAFDDLWPADLIIEAHDQTRGWFWSQLGMGGASMGEVPYEEVLMHGYANMPDGRGMSKSKGILVDPHDVIDEHGRDPMRLFLLSVTAQGEDMNFSWDETQEMQRRLNILWNVFRFPLPYMRADGFDPESVALSAQRAGGGDSEARSASNRSSGQSPREEAAGETTVEADLELIDEWLLSRLQTVKAEMNDAFDDFEHDKGLNALLDFVVEDVSRFYIQEVRERMWEEENSPSKLAAYATLYRVLEEGVALLAPYAPFISEEIYQHLTGEAGHPTVHMCDFPERDGDWQNVGLEDDITVVRAVEEAGSNARQQAERKLRWPVKRVVVDVETGDLSGTVELRGDLIADRLNARDVEIIEPDADWGELTYSAEADMSKLGPAFGGDAQAIMQACNDARIAEPSIEALESTVSEELGRGIDLQEDMVEFVRQLPDGVAGTAFEALDGEGVVYVDTTLTEDIESEGYAREAIRRIQEMRKDLELDLEARIRVDLDISDDRIADLVAEREALIKEEVRADELGRVEDGHRKTWDVEGIEMEIAVVPVAETDA